MAGQHPLHGAQADDHVLGADDLPDAAGEVPAQGQAEPAWQLAGDSDHQRPHPIVELGRTSGPGRVLEREPLLHPASPPLADPRRALAQPSCGLRAAKVGLLVQQEGEPGSLHLGVWEDLRTSPGPGLVDLGLGEARLVGGRRATVPGVTGTGRGLYRRQGAPPSVGSSARRPFQRTRRSLGYNLLPLASMPSGVDRRAADEAALRVGRVRSPASLPNAGRTVPPIHSNKDGHSSRTKSSNSRPAYLSLPFA